MTRLQATAAVLLAACAFSTIAAAAAQAEEAPYWSIEGTRLAAGKTFEISAKAVGSEGGVPPTAFHLLGGDPEVTCTALKFAKGSVLLGSNAGEPGKADETFEYSGCSVTGNGEPCEPTNKEVKTEPLTNELAYAANKKSLVMLFTPVKGKTYATLQFTGSGCKEASAKATGVAVAGVYTDVTSPVLLELPNPVAQAESFRVKFTEISPEKIWLIKGGTGSEVETEEVTFFGEPGRIFGTTLLSLAVKGTSINKKWSPLL
jgi:hypothetical protein